MHLVQAFTLFFDDGNLTHWRFGYFIFLPVGLYLPRSFFRVTATIEVLPQMVQVLIYIEATQRLYYAVIRQA